MSDKNLKKPYAFSFVTAIGVTILGELGVVTVEALFLEINVFSLLLFFPVFFAFSFFFIQFRVQHYLYKKITRLSKKVSFLEETPLEEEEVITNMENLTQRVETFAENKRLEIENLKFREQYRREFIGNVSHELKTPLFTVEGYILTLLDGALEDKEQAKKFLKRAHNGVERLIDVVKDLDMITKLEGGRLKLEKEDFDLVVLIQSVFEMMEMKANEKKITLTLDRAYNRPLWGFADREKIHRVLSNLIVNSIKYGRKKGTTEVAIESINQDHYLIRITDNGEGFKEKNIPRLFERFYRVDKSGSRKEGGSGLGLSIVKHILEAHGEKIYVESDYGLGSEFSFTLKRGSKPRQ